MTDRAETDERPQLRYRKLDSLPLETRKRLWADEERRMLAESPILTNEGKEAAWRNTLRMGEVVRVSVTARAKDVLERLMVQLMTMVELYQPWPERMGKNPSEDRDLWERYVILTMKCASELAPYQSPKAVLIKDDREHRPPDEYDLSKLSDEQLLALRQLLVAAKPVMIEVKSS